MSGWGGSARRLAGAVALALALTAAAVLAGWGQPGAPVFALGDAPPPGDPAAQGRALARRPAEDLPPNGAARARRPAGWSPAALPRGEAAPGRVWPLLGVIGYKPAVVARLDPRTLRLLPGPRIRLRYGVSGYGWSPDGSLLVLGDVDDDVLHLVDPVRLRRLGTVRFGIVARAPRWLAWLGPRRLAVVAGDPGDGAHLLLVDPVARKVLSRRQLEPAGLSVVPAGDRLVLLQSPSDRLGPVRLLVVDARGRVRTAELPGVTAGVQSPPDWDRPGAYAVSRDAALAVDLEGGRAFVAAAGAVGAMLVLDLGSDAPPLLVDVPSGEAASDEPAPGPIPHVHPLAPPDVDAERAELTAPMGAIDMAARAVRELAAGYPGRSVVTVQWATTDADVPLTIAARRGEPLVIALGAQPFPLAEGWPPA